MKLQSTATVRRRPLPSLPPSRASESLVFDPRGEISPAEMVEKKLCSILGDSAIRLSEMRLDGLPRYRDRR